MKRYPKYKPSNIPWIGVIPNHWEEKKLKYLLKSKLEYGANEPSGSINENDPRYIRITDFDDTGKLRDDTFNSVPYENAKDYLLKEGDILFARSGATVGKTFQFKNYFGLACFAGYLIRARVNKKIILSDFLYLFTKTEYYSKWCDSIFNQATIQNIGADKYSFLMVPSPPIDEQLQIAAYLDSKTQKLDKLISNKQKQIELLKEEQQSIINNAVTGKVTSRFMTGHSERSEESDLPRARGVVSAEDGVDVGAGVGRGVARGISGGNVADATAAIVAAHAAAKAAAEAASKAVKYKATGIPWLGDIPEHWEDEEDNNCIEEEYLRKYLTERKYSETLINKALFELRRAAEDQNKSLYDINKEVYSYLRYGVKVKEDIGENTKTVELIDWKEPHKNHFAIAEEVTVKGQNDKRPDIVLYINGIALGVLELKRSTISVSEGIRQNLDNQKSIFIKNFFATIQLVMAGNDTEGLRYGVIETHEKYYLKWKEDSDVENPLDKHLLNICQKERLLELIHDYIVFDCGDKKICRHYQYFGIKEAQKYLARREGGIIWHTQGSGKSLTMIWLAKWIRENITNSRVLIITDRDELDKQIEGKFIGVSEEIYRTKSQDGKSGGRILIEKLNTTTPWLLCSLIHKFGRKEEADYDDFIEDLNKYLPKDFSAKGDLYVFVDECHRTQSGKLHKAMKKIIPNAIFIGFTGTPLIKTDKQKTIDIFGGYIHKYRFDEGVADEVIRDLQYEARKVDQNITSQEKIDQWFEAKTKGLTPYAKTELKKRWATMQNILSSQGRLEKIVADIMLDMETKDRLKSGYGNAMLVAGSIYEACKYYQLFQEHGLKKCAIITSYNATISQIKGEAIGDDEETENIFKYDIYQKMLNGKSVEMFEEEVKNKFIHEPAQMKLLIVVDKLLTGFDAPPATYLYIDKSMQDHGLFQAVCRVNRLDTDDKEYGYIIDYKDLFNSLQESFKDYTSAAFDSYDKEDVAGLLNDRLTKAKEHLDESLENIHALCDPVEPTKDSNAFRKYFCSIESGNIDELNENEQKRITLYKLTAILIRAYASIANEMIEAGYTEKEIEDIKQKVKYYEQVRQEVKLSSGDYIDLKAYEPAMRHLIDTYISAEESKVISAFDDLTLVDMLVERGAEAVNSLPKHISQNKKAVAETIENNVRRLIIDEMPTNPKYFESMSVLLDELIKQRNQETLDYEKYLSKIIELSKQVKNPNTSFKYSNTLNTKAKRALYDNLNMNEPLAISLDNDLHMRKPADFRGNKIKERVVKNIVRENLEKYGINEEKDVDKIFDLIKNQNEY